LKSSERRDAYLAAIAAEYADDPYEAEALARYLHLPAPLIKLMKDAATLVRLWPQLGEEISQSQVYNLLKELDVGSLQALSRLTEMSADEVAWTHLNEYLNKLRHMKTELTGEYLRELGVAPGHVYREVLEELLAAKLDGEVTNREDEEEFVRERLRARGLV
jgi:tRNA nucleotidyltransferase (CCA-adding enzyme)